MENLGAESVIKKRQFLRMAADLLAGPLEGEAKAAFLADQEARINRSYPAPSPANMRSYLKANMVR